MSDHVGSCCITQPKKVNGIFEWLSKLRHSMANPANWVLVKTKIELEIYTLWSEYMRSDHWVDKAFTIIHAD